jgi:hypothetical protein
MTTKNLALSLIVVPFLIACGGGSSSTDNGNERNEQGETNTGNGTGGTTGGQTSTTQKAKITGTVPGTLIEAFCADGSYAQVTSTNNGTSKHPFEITVPKSTACKLVMTMNESNSSTRIINNIGFDNNTTQGTSISINQDLNLGNVPLPTNYATISDTDNNHLNDNPVYVNTNARTISTTPIQDSDNNGIIDAYDDKDSDGIVNAYEDDNNDGILNIHEDRNHDGKPDFIEDDNNDGRINFLEDNNGNGRPDYADDSNGDGIENHLENNNLNDNGNNSTDNNQQTESNRGENQNETNNN